MGNRIKNGDFAVRRPQNNGPRREHKIKGDFAVSRPQNDGSRRKSKIKGDFAARRPQQNTRLKEIFTHAVALLLGILSPSRNLAPKMPPNFPRF